MIKRLFLYVFLLFFCVMPARSVTLKVMSPSTNTPIEIQMYSAKRTERALAVRMTDGTIYYADMAPVDTSFPGAMFMGIDTQIYQVGARPISPEFFITTTPTTSSFSFKMSAMGDFMVDWGDGETEEITRTNTTETEYSHIYAVADTYTITITGKATGYSTNDSDAAISFSDNTNIASVDGSLGAIFGTIGGGTTDDQQPRFYNAFCDNTNLTSIPETLFAGITGPAASRMFSDTFYGCTGLTSLPSGLFSTITGPAAGGMFYNTFYGCTGLTSLPNNLFGTITAPAEYMFGSTFASCTGLTSLPADLFSTITGPAASHIFDNTFSFCSGLTSLPSGLFSTITGPAAEGMFFQTFSYCNGLTSLPDNLFGDLSGDAQSDMFTETFSYCTNLSGPSARTTSGQYLYEIWPDATTDEVSACYIYDTGLDDYDSIPWAWK